MNDKIVTKKNRALKKELSKRGFYTQTIGQTGFIDYIIVSCVEPYEKQSSIPNYTNTPDKLYEIWTGGVFVPSYEDGSD